MSRQFDRRAIVTIGGRRIEGLRVRFRVTRDLGPQASPAEIRVYNLSRDSRAWAASSDAVLLEAGYEGRVETVFLGKVDHVASTREGPDWVTTISAGDGLEAWESRVSLTGGDGLDPAEVFRQMMRQVPFAAGNAFDKIRERGPAGAMESIEAFSRSLVLEGPAMEQIQSLAEDMGFQVSVQGGELQLLWRGTGREAVDLTDEPPVVLAPSTGLVGSPVVGSDGEVKAQCLLHPDLRPGRAVLLESREVRRGGYRVERVTFDGDTHGRQWYADLELRPLARPIGREVPVNPVGMGGGVAA